MTTTDGAGYAAFAVLLAMGSTYRRLGIDGEDDLIGAGVHFCATCDGAFYRGKRLVVIGGGNSAGEESIFLTRFADQSPWSPVVRSSRPAGWSSTKLAQNDKISVVTGATPVGFATDGGRLRALVVDRDGERVRDRGGRSAFVFVGQRPNSALVADLVDLDGAGFVRRRSGDADQPGQGSSSPGTSGQARPSRPRAPPGRGPPRLWRSGATWIP